jgi:DNA-binding NarL/FixJ family response regulator
MEVIEAIRQVARGKRYLSNKISNVLVDDFIKEGSDAGSPISSLSGREFEVVNLVVVGHTSMEIGDILHISSKTVDTYRQRAMRKLGVEDLASLVRFAVQHGLGSTESGL